MKNFLDASFSRRFLRNWSSFPGEDRSEPGQRQFESLRARAIRCAAHSLRYLRPDARFFSPPASLSLRFPLSAYILLFSYLTADIVMPNGYNPLFSYRQLEVYHSQPSSRVRPHLSSTKFLTAPGIAPCLHPRAFPYGPSVAGAAPRCEGSGHQWMANIRL